MTLCTTHIAAKLRATATLLLLMLCVCSTVAREKKRTIALPFEDSVYNFRMLFEYDTWNRVQRIVYPDSEVVAHGNSLRGIVKELRQMTNDEIIEFNIPTAIPYIFELDDNYKVQKHFFLGDPEVIARKMQSVANQASKK